MKNEALQLLENALLSRQEKNPLYSLRAFSRFLEVSPAQLSQILSGKRKLSQKHASRFADRLGLSPREKTDFLTSLIAPEIALTHSAENAARENLKEEEFRSIAEWYHFAILSLLETKNAKSDPRWISRRLGIPIATANEAIERLVKLGILERTTKLKQCRPPLQVVSDIPSAAIRKHHRQTLQLAENRLETTPKEMREYHSITFPANPARLKNVEKIIDRFLTDISKEMEDQDASEVYTLAVQLFPATKPTLTEPK